MEETKQRLKVYCETTFWSYLNGGRTPLSDAGYQCPIIITPEEFLNRKEEFGYGN